MRWMKILDENYYDLIINNAIAPIYANDDNITYINERHALIHLPAADNICSLGTMPYHIFPSLFEATSPISLGASGIISIQENPHLDLQGLGYWSVLLTPELITPILHSAILTVLPESSLFGTRPIKMVRRRNDLPSARNIRPRRSIMLYPQITLIL